MAKKNRPSVLKRQREAEKRQRQSGKVAAAALKRERRLERDNERSEAAPSEDLPKDSEPPDPVAEPIPNPLAALQYGVSDRTDSDSPARSELDESDHTQMP